ncbi:MAG: flagellar biosynthesis protein FlgE [Epsilonproteobacteria bacterium]|nr:flagellar biosynthesis protein FlgE [Campylobacterota bacterium]
MMINATSMMAHQTLMDINANNVANVNTQDFQASDGRIGNNLEVNAATSEFGTNLTKELTDQIVIEDGFKAQAPAIKTQDEMTQTLLDIKA